MLDPKIAEDKLIIDACRSDLLSYAMAIHPKFVNNDFAESVAYEIQNCLEGDVDRLMIFAPPRHGKELANSVPVLKYSCVSKTYEYSTHGTLVAGDKVLHRDGNFYEIVATNKPILSNMRITLSNGEVIDCHENHEWVVRDVELERKRNASYRGLVSYYRKQGRPIPEKDNSLIFKTYETKELFSLGTMCSGSKPLGQRGYRARFQIRASKLINFPHTVLPVDPYWFGYWLGDGSYNMKHIYVGASDYEVCKNHMSNTIGVDYEHYDRTNNVYRLKNKILNLTKDEKYIPDEYIFNSVENRLQLLAGLIDSDGHVEKPTGRVRFVNTNKRLIDDVMRLVRSLGLKPYITSQEPALSSSGVQGTKTVYTVGFQSNLEIPTIYERKKVKLTEVDPYVSIEKIEYVPEDEQEEGFCIQVNSPDNTYCVGDTLIETHNSFITSETAPAWFLGKYPDKKIIAASHTASLAEDMGMIVRDKLNDPVHMAIFGRDGSLARGKAASDNFRTNAGGQYFGVGVGGTPIGKGADVYIIDDPIRSRADVESELQREALKAWYSSAVLSRLEGKGKIILMHQRWHEDDLAGWLLREHADDGWRVICFPAIIEDEEDMSIDYLSREIGEVLIPELHNKEKLVRLKNNMLTRDWLSMYQQRPAGASGDRFSEGMFLRYDSDPMVMAQGMNVYLIADPAQAEKITSDYTSMVVVGSGADGNYYLLDGLRDRLDLGEKAEALINLHRKWRPIATGYESYGAQADIQYIRYMQESQNYRFPVLALGGNSKAFKKEARIERLIPDMRNGRWYFPHAMARMNKKGEEYDFMEVLVDECLAFPVGKFDDTPDSLSRIYDMPVMFPSTKMPRVSSGSQLLSPW